jgi:hypothetical protein
MQRLVLVNSRLRAAALMFNLRCSILYVHVSKTAHYFLGRLALISEAMVARALRSSLYMIFDLPNKGFFLLAVRRCARRAINDPPPLASSLRGGPLDEFVMPGMFPCPLPRVVTGAHRRQRAVCRKA